MQTLATKCRMKARNANKILAALRSSGELEVQQNEGPHGTNRYRVVLKASPLSVLTGAVNSDRVSKRTATPVKTYPKPLSVLTGEPSVNHQEPPVMRTAQKLRIASSPAVDVDSGFSDFWQSYPKRVDKVRAMKAWTKAKLAGQMLNELLAGLQRQKASADWQKDGGQFVPHPATWLTGRRWEDEIIQGAKSAESDNPIFAGAV